METKLKYIVDGTVLKLELSGDYLKYDDNAAIGGLYEGGKP